VFTKSTIEGIEERVTSFCQKYFKFKERAHLVDIDFTKTWWDVLVKQKMLVAIQVINLFVVNVVINLLPILAAWVFTQRNIWYFVWLLIALFVYRALAHIMFYADTLLVLQTKTSLQVSANKHLLLVDPIHHSTRSSGQIISKISRLSNSYRELIALSSFEILALVGNLVVTIGAFWVVDTKYGLLAGGLLGITIICNILGIIWKTSFTEKRIIEYEDISQELNIQAMNQTQYIRASFATPQIVHQIDTANFESLWRRGTSWRMSAWLITLTQYLFFLGFGVIGLVMIQDRSVDVVVLVAIMFSYLNTGNRIYFIGFTINSIMESYIGVVDSWKFIQDYGSQSYPVLEVDKDSSLKVV
jgi:hypothetical protein